MVLSDIEIEIYIDGDKFWEYGVALIGISSDDVAKILENEYGFAVEWLDGVDFEFWRYDEVCHIEGVVWGVSDVDVNAVIVNADEWLVRAIFDRVEKECEILEGRNEK